MEGRSAARLRAAASQPVDAASVAVFRIAFGVAMVVDAALYLPVQARAYYVDTSVHFGYEPFASLLPSPGQGIHVVYGALAVAGALVALGWRTRAAAAGVFVTNTYIFLLDSTFFQNHEYLISLLALLLVAVPSDRVWSLRARRRAGGGPPPTVPRGVVWLLRFQVGVPYAYAGLAKLNADWMHGEPLRLWLAGRTDLEPIRSVLTTEAVVGAMGWGALVFDLAVVPLLLHRRTRPAAFAVAVCFHVTNAWLFGLYVFPWLMIGATTIFFPPGWPRRLAERARERRGERSRTVRAAPTVGGQPVPAGAGGRGRRRLRARAAVAVAVVWVAAQLLIPLRHHLVPGDPSWTEQAHRFSWHMRLRSKASTVTFLVDDGDEVVRVDPGDHLGEKQASRLGGHPERLVQFARHLSDLHGGAEVRARTSVSLNGRPPQPIVDPTVDLSSVSYRSHRANDWVLPLEEPRRRSTG